MITPNTDSSFIQVKSVKTWNIYQAKKNCAVAEVIEMTAQRTVGKPSVSVGTKREDKICKSTMRLDDLLMNTVDETLKQVFKEAGAKVIYSFIEYKCHLKREEIAEKIEDFAAGLEGLLGSGAAVIEKLILENLCSKLRLSYGEKEGYRFSDYIKELREKCGC